MDKGIKRSESLMDIEQAIISAIRQYLPEVQAIYLFGSWGTGDEWPDSDVDVAVLLPAVEAKRTGSLAASDLQEALVATVKKDVDLINIRQVSTVFQKEIITTGRRLFCADETRADEFEMVVLSLYQKLNEERAGILEEAMASGRFYE
jgi:uncharacterized protein